MWCMSPEVGPPGASGSPLGDHLRTKRLDDGSIVQLRQLVLQLVDDPEVRVITYFADRDGDADDVEFDT